MLAASLEGRGEPQQVALGHALDGFDADEDRLALRQGPGLVHDDGVHAFERLEGLRVPDEDPGGRAAPGADHDRHGRGQPQGARARDDQHRDRVHERVREARLGSPPGPGGERREGDEDHGRDEPGGHAVDELLDRRAAALRVGDHTHDAREHGVAPDGVGPHDEGAGSVHGPARDHVTRGLLDGDGLAAQHRLVHAAAAVDDRAVDGDPLARPHAEPIPRMDLLEGHVDLAPAFLEPARGRRSQSQQRADGVRGPAPRPQLEHLTEQDQGGDDGRGLEVHGDRSVRRAEGGREEARRQERHEAEPVGDADSQRDEGEHVQAPGQDGTPAALEEGPARPQDDRARQRQLEGVAQASPGQQVREPGPHRSHRDDEQGRAQRDAHAQAPRHVGELGVLLVARGRSHRLERHPAAGTRAGAVLDHLGVHGAGPLAPGRLRGRGGRVTAVGLREVAVRVVAELARTPGAAEGVRLARMGHLFGGFAGVDLHAADGVGGEPGGGRGGRRAVEVVAVVVHLAGSGFGVVSGARRGDPPAGSSA